jgi:hypothetical protein
VFPTSILGAIGRDELGFSNIENEKTEDSLCLINHAISCGNIWGNEGIAPPFLTSELDIGEWPAPC